jgi:hypothetical protein
MNSKGTYYERLVEAIKNGEEGKNLGIPTGFDALDDYLGGVRKSCYYLCGSNTGVGKTAFIDYTFIISPLHWLMKNPSSEKKLKVFYYSFEIDIESKLVKWAALLLYLDTKIIVSTDDILSAKRIKGTNDIKKLSPEIKEQILKLKYYFDYIEENVELVDISINPTGIFKQTQKYCEENGKWEKIIKTIEGKEREISIYVPNDINQITLLVIDHYGLIKVEQLQGTTGKSTKKQSIDKLDEYCIELRNKYGISPVMISQFNRDIADIQRVKIGNVKPNLEDFKESGNTAESANVVIAPFYPARYNLPNYMGYILPLEISHLFRYIFILKNRGNKDMVGIPMRFLGQCGFFEELPNKPEDYTYMEIKDWSKPVTKINIVEENEQQQQQSNDNRSNTTSNYTDPFR